MAAVAGLIAVIAHGGVGGAVVEALLVAGIAAIFVALWLRERRARSAEEPGDEADQIKPQ